MVTGKRILIVGGVAGGASCAARARRLSEDAQITMFERGPNISFANCGLPYYIGGTIKKRDSLMVQTPERMNAWFNLNIKTLTEVVQINREKKEVIAKNLSTGEEKTYPYDFLVLSPGAAPVKPPIEGIDSPKVFTLRNLEDTDKIKRFIDESKPKNAVVVGAGYIGLEMVEALYNRGIKVTVVELLPQVMAAVDYEMTSPVLNELKDHGVIVKLGTSAQKIEEIKGKLHIHLSNGEIESCDLAIISVGVKPESKLAKDAGLEIGERGGIVVDPHMRTSDPSIFAVGDAVEVIHYVGGNKTMIPLAGPANRQGRIAADNIFGRDSSYKNTQGTAICKVFDVAVAGTGLLERELKRLNRKYQKVYTHPFSHASYYPGSSILLLKVMFDPDNGKILGAQAVGREGVDKTIDVLAVAIRAGLTVHDLEELELTYAPPFGSAKSPVNYAGFVASNIIKGDTNPSQIEDILDGSEGKLLLDVRNRGEIEQFGIIPHAVNIPLPELRGRLDELPKDKEIIVYCRVGIRGYIAERILLQRGFNARNLIGGFRSYMDFTGNSLPMEPGN